MAAALDRPNKFVPLSVRFLTGRTGTRLRQRFGRDGPLVWLAYLAACKLNRSEGEISYASEAEGWGLLGLGDDPPSFTLEEFFKVTGQLKKTRRRRSGDVVYTVCTVWGRWSEAKKREHERTRKARYRQESGRDITRNPQGTENGQGRDLELERDIDREEEKGTNVPSSENPVRLVYDHWRQARNKTHSRFTKISDNRRAKIAARLKEFTVEELVTAIDGVALDPWPERPRHDDLTVIFRNREQVEKFLALAESSNGDLPAIRDPSASLSASEIIAMTKGLK